MNKAQTIELAGEFLRTTLTKQDWFTQVESSIKAYVLYGSRAKETHRPDSDIDILLILPLDVEEKYTDGEYVYMFKDFEINIVLRSIEKLRKISFDKNDEFQKEVFRKAIVIIDTDGEVTKLLEEIDQIKD